MQEQKFNTISSINILKNSINLSKPLLYIMTAVGLFSGHLVLWIVAVLHPTETLSYEIINGIYQSITHFGDSSFTFGQENLNSKEALLFYSDKFLNGLFSTVLIFISGMFGGAGIIFLILKKLSAKHSNRYLNDKHLRGSDILREPELAKLQKNIKGAIVGAIAKIDEAYETMHGIIIGSSGTGKSVFLKRLYLWQKKNRPNGKWIIHDVKGDWVASFYDSNKDFIFNFSDTRSINFNVFSIIKSVNDIKSIVATIIPRNPNEKEPIWTDSARDILEGCFYYCISNDKKTNQDMKQLILLSHKDLAEKLSVIQGAEIAFGHLSSSPTQAGNFMSNFRSKAAFFSSVPDTNLGIEINIEEWINEQGQSTIFLYNNTKDKDLNASRISVFVDSIVKTLLSMGESKSRRVYFFLDEFGSLNKMDSIVDGLALLRSFGGSIWIGIQEVQRIYSIYDKNLTSTIINNIATKVILRSQEVETLEFCSKLIGKQEIEQTNMNSSIGTQANRDGVSYNKTIKENTTVLASEIAGLANNEFYFKNGDYNWTHIKTAFQSNRDFFPVINEHFIERSDLLLKNMEFKKISDFQASATSTINSDTEILCEESVGW